MSEILTEKIYKIFTAKKIRKSWPFNPGEIKRLISRSLEHGQEIVLVTNWLGVKTTQKGMADEADEVALIFLRENIIKEISKLGIGIRVKILFTDINASYLEGYTSENIDLYWSTLKPVANRVDNNFELIRVNSELWRNLFKLDGQDDLTLDEIVNKIGDTDILEEVKTRAQKVIKSPIFIDFVNMANKHSLFVKNSKMTAEEVAKRYIYFRIFARRRYKKMFPNEIYFSYAEPRFNEVIISQPSIYLYSLHRGFSDCPWFIDENYPRFVELIKLNK